MLCAEVRLVRVTFYSLAATRPGGRAGGRARAPRAPTLARKPREARPRWGLRRPRAGVVPYPAARDRVASRCSSASQPMRGSAQPRAARLIVPACTAVARLLVAPWAGDRRLPRLGAPCTPSLPVPVFSLGSPSDWAPGSCSASRARPGPLLARRPAQAGTLWRRRACLSHSDCRLCCVGRRGCLKRRANPSHRLHRASGSAGSPHGLCSPVSGTRGREGPGGGRRNATGRE